MSHCGYVRLMIKLMKMENLLQVLFRSLRRAENGGGCQFYLHRNNKDRQEQRLTANPTTAAMVGFEKLAKASVRSLRNLLLCPSRVVICDNSEMSIPAGYRSDGSVYIISWRKRGSTNRKKAHQGHRSVRQCAQNPKSQAE